MGENTREPTREGGLARRDLIRAAGVLAAGAPLPAVAAEGPSAASAAAPDVTGRLARYMVAAASRPLPPMVAEAAKQRVLDTLAAIVSGSTLPPGKAVAAYVRAQGGTAQCSMLTTDIRTTATNAAFANAMLAHSDETDDFDPLTKSHPGCSVVPAALALGELQNSSGADLMRAVALGYDLCCRCLMALDPDEVRRSGRSAEGTGTSFGAVGAASALARFDERRMRYALSYAAQQTSGLWTWERDTDHIEKAFDFSGMGARNGVMAVTMIQAGFTGVTDALDGENNMITSLSNKPRPEEMVARLGERFFVSETAIKVFSVGYPIQSPLDAFLKLHRAYNLTPANVARIVVRLPADGAHIVNNSAMPDVNCQHLIAVALIDGDVSFETSHSRERMADPAVLAVRAKVELIEDKALVDPAAPRSGLVEVTLTDGRMVREFTKYPPGQKENPLSPAQVEEKARKLMTSVLGADRTGRLIAMVRSLETLPSVRDLVALAVAQR